MQTPLAVYIGKRFASVRSRHFLTGVISLLSVVGLSLGVAILITVLSVMNGFDRELRERVLGIVPHITMQSSRSDFLLDRNTWAEIQTGIQSISGVTGSAPYLQVQGMLLANGKSKGIVLNGIDPEAERDISSIDDFLIDGEYQNLEDRSYSILIGDALADLLGVNVGDRLTLVSTVVPITPLGEFIRQKQFTVGGIFRVGSQLDSGLAIAHMADVQRVYRLGDAIQGLRLQVDDLFDVNTISQDIRSNVSDNFQIANWTWDYGNIYENIRLSKTLVGLLLSLLIAVAAFNVVVSLVMIVKEKEGDIAILRAMGTSLENIRNIFLVQGFSIGIMGTGAGLFLGLFFALTVSDIVTLLEKVAGIEFLSADIYPVNYLPSQIEFADVFLVCCVSLLLTVLATLLPARSAALVDPAEALRYE
jgi:lipoprotein-releasing system permease protein